MFRQDRPRFVVNGYAVEWGYMYGENDCDWARPYRITPGIEHKYEIIQDGFNALVA
ncbi:MAG: hypothetical protein FWE95_03805 [Planctomycetaceae bacterium]|nr:hypothetical protein [Planctomycetaceae bacterium]